jgi:hypothetical protein
MYRSILLLVVLFVSLTVSAFAATSAKPAKDLHGAQGAKPGSYEDWCGDWTPAATNLSSRPSRPPATGTRSTACRCRSARNATRN